MADAPSPTAGHRAPGGGDTRSGAQLYEMAAVLPIAFMLVRWRRKGQLDRFVLGAYLTLAGALRFLIEFVRVNERVALGLSVAHFASLAVAIVGIGLLLTRRVSPRRPSPGAASAR